MKNTPWKKSLNALTHPLTVIMLILIPVNALIFQPLAPSWLTGKLGDLAWVVVLPLFVSVLFQRIWLAPDEKPFAAAALLTGSGFALLKILPPFNQMIRQGFSLIFQQPLKLALDPSDLLALAGLPIAWWIWQQDWRPRKGRLWLIPVTLILIAGMADAPLRISYVYEFDCVMVTQDILIAFTIYHSHPPERTMYISLDNGEEWDFLGEVTLDDPETLPKKLPPEDYASACRAWNKTTTLEDPQNPRIAYLAVKGQGIYRSVDGGAHYTLEYATKEYTNLHDMTFAPDEATLVIAAGENGLLLRQPDGSYIWAFPDPTMNPTQSH